MDRPYSAWADLLNKIHTSSDIIQALWILAVPATILGTALCIAWAAREIATARACNRPGKLQDWAAYAIYRTPEGRWMVLAQGRARELAKEDIPALPPIWP